MMTTLRTGCILGLITLSLTAGTAQAEGTTTTSDPTGATVTLDANGNFKVKGTAKWTRIWEQAPSVVDITVKRSDGTIVTLHRCTRANGGITGGPGAREVTFEFNGAYGDNSGGVYTQGQRQLCC